MSLSTSASSVFDQLPNVSAEVAFSTPLLRYCTQELSMVPSRAVLEGMSSLNSAWRPFNHIMAASYNA